MGNSLPCYKPTEEELEKLRVKREWQAKYRAAAEELKQKIESKDPNHDWKLSNPYLGLYDLRDWNDDYHVWKNLSGGYPPHHPDPYSLFNENMDAYDMEEYERQVTELWKSFTEEQLQTEFKRWAARKAIEIEQGRGYPHEADGFYDCREWEENYAKWKWEGGYTPRYHPDCYCLFNQDMHKFDIQEWRR